MGLLDSFKKALGGKPDTAADTIASGAPQTAPAAGELAPAEPTPAVTPDAAPVQADSYTVQSGDTLWSIAETVYGDGSKYTKIFAANSDLLENPEQIFPGQKLHIPDLDGQEPVRSP